MTRHVDFEALFKEAQENVRRLNECPGPHDLDELNKFEFRCRKCGGTVRKDKELFWYMQGLRHGRGEKGE